MSWFSKRLGKSTTRRSVVKRRGSSAERLIFWVRRVGFFVAAFIFVGWLGAWFFMSGASVKFLIGPE